MRHASYEMLYEAVGGRGTYKSDFQDTFLGRRWTGQKNTVTHRSTRHKEAMEDRPQHTRARRVWGQRKKISTNGRRWQRDRSGEISTSGRDVRKVPVNSSTSHP